MDENVISMKIISQHWGAAFFLLAAGCSLAQSPPVVRIQQSAEIAQRVAREDARRAVVLAAAQADSKVHGGTGAVVEAVPASAQAMAEWVRKCVEKHARRCEAMSSMPSAKSSSRQPIDIAAQVAAHAQKQAMIASLDSARGAGEAGRFSVERSVAENLRSLNEQFDTKINPKETKP